MKVLFANSFYYPVQPGGAERSVKRLVDMHVSAGHEVSVVTTHDGRDVTIDQVDGATVYRLPPHNIYWARQTDQPVAWQRALWHGLDCMNLGVQRDLSKILDDVKPDIINSNNLSGLSISLWSAAAQAGVPVVQVLRDYYNICPNTAALRGGRHCAKQCARCHLFRLPHRRLSVGVAAVVGVSHHTLNRHLSEGYFEGVPIQEVIYSAQPPAAGQFESRVNDVVTLGYIGSLTEVKGVWRLLEIVESLRAGLTKPLRVLLAGNGPEAYVKRLKQRFEGAGVQFVGYMRPEDFFPQCDVLIVPSLWDDPQPGVVVQGLAHGLPVIGSKRGGIPEMITHDSNGLLYEPDRDHELIDAICAMVNDPAQRARHAAAARASAKTFLDVNLMFERYQAVYAAVLKGRYFHG